MTFHQYIESIVCPGFRAAYLYAVRKFLLECPQILRVHTNVAAIALEYAEFAEGHACWLVGEQFYSVKQCTETCVRHSSNGQQFRF